MDTNNDLVRGVDPETRLPRKGETVASLVAATVILVGIASGIYFHNKQFEEIACRQMAAIKKCLNEGDIGTDDGKKKVTACANSNLFNGDFIRNDHELGKLVREISSGEEDGACEETPAD